MLALRRTTPALIAGDYQDVDAHHADALAFLRRDTRSEQTCLVALNFSNQALQVVLDLDDRQPRLLFSSHGRADQLLDLGALTLTPFEILIVELA